MPGYTAIKTLKTKNRTLLEQLLKKHTNSKTSIKTEGNNENIQKIQRRKEIKELQNEFKKKSNSQYINDHIKCILCNHTD